MNPIRVCILDTSVKHKARVPVHIHTHTLYLSIHTTKRSLRNNTSVFEDNGSNTIFTSYIPKKILSWGNQAKYNVICAALHQKGVNCHLLKTSQLRQE